MASKAYEAAKALSAFLHEGQVDKAGQPYYLHPLAVSEKVDSEDEKIAALLHDVLEDTRATEDTIRNLFGDEVADAVVSLTKKDGEDYMDFIRRAAQNEIAKKSKWPIWSTTWIRPGSLFWERKTWSASKSTKQPTSI